MAVLDNPHQVRPDLHCWVGPELRHFVVLVLTWPSKDLVQKTTSCWRLWSDTAGLVWPDLRWNTSRQQQLTPVANRRKMERPCLQKSSTFAAAEGSRTGWTQWRRWGTSCSCRVAEFQAASAPICNLTRWGQEEACARVQAQPHVLQVPAQKLTSEKCSDDPSVHEGMK